MFITSKIFCIMYNVSVFSSLVLVEEPLAEESVGEPYTVKIEY